MTMNIKEDFTHFMKVTEKNRSDEEFDSMLIHAVNRKKYLLHDDSIRATREIMALDESLDYIIQTKIFYEKKWLRALWLYHHLFDRENKHLYLKYKKDAKNQIHFYTSLLSYYKESL